MKNNSILFIITLLYLLASTIAGAISGFLLIIPILGIIIYLAVNIGVPLFGLQVNKTMMDATNNTEINVFEFSKFKKAIFAALWTLFYMLPSIVTYFVGTVIMLAGMAFSLEVNYLKEITTFSAGAIITMIIGFIIMIIGAIFLIIQQYSYALAINMVYDGNIYDHLTAKETVQESKKIMTGHKCELFILQLSFIGWILLIGIVNIIPILGQIAFFAGLVVFTVYLSLTQIQFYKALTQNNLDITK